jgi:hypothetical protein
MPCGPCKQVVDRQLEDRCYSLLGIFTVRSSPLDIWDDTRESTLKEEQNKYAHYCLPTLSLAAPSIMEHLRSVHSSLSIVSQALLDKEKWISHL